MFFQLLTLATLMFAQEPATQTSPQSSNPESFSIYRVDPNNHVAVIAHYDVLTPVKIGDKYKIQTPEGFCHTPVSEVIDGFFYVNTEQCRNEDVKKGAPLLAMTKPVIVNRASASNVQPDNYPGNETAVSTSENRLFQSEFFKDYIADKLSVYVGYHAGNSLDGQLRVDTQSTITELNGAHTIGVGAEYEFAKLPYRLSSVGGFSYNLPRSYGRYNLNTSNTPQTFTSDPELQLWSFYLNLRYRFLKEAYFFMGINRLLASMSNLPGKTSGDFGFHTGARYYATPRIFVEGVIEFYNLNYRYQGTTTDVSLTEFELKGGYTF